MSALEEVLAPPKGSARIVRWLSGRMGPVSRRDVLVGAAVAGSAMATDPAAYALRPQTAYATICGPGNTASSGWSVFCATINNGLNTCPPGSFAAGWWKAAGSSWCGGGYRYIVDCNASCSRCSSGCSDHLCDSACWSCSCSSGSTATCDQRRVCCNAFRYGQCNTQVACSGGVHCRVVSCVAPYTWERCTTTSFQDDRTAEHSSSLLPTWGPIEAHYKAKGAQASWLKWSKGPVRALSDRRGTYVFYDGGTIYFTATTGAAAISNFVYGQYAKAGGPFGPLGYPIGDLRGGLIDSGWRHLFEHGVITDSAATSTQPVIQPEWTVWQLHGTEAGDLGYPIQPVAVWVDGRIQLFQRGAVSGALGKPVFGVAAYRFVLWQQTGREHGILGYPTGEWVLRSDGGTQPFVGGAITDSYVTATQLVLGVMWAAWRAQGQAAGVLGYPTTAQVTSASGSSQVFQHGELWGRTGGPAYAVRGAVLSAWRAAGGATGRYGYPLTHTTVTTGGLLTCTFEGGVITA